MQGADITRFFQPVKRASSLDPADLEGDAKRPRHGPGAAAGAVEDGGGGEQVVGPDAPLEKVGSLASDSTTVAAEEAQLAGAEIEGAGAAPAAPSVLQPAAEEVEVAAGVESEGAGGAAPAAPTVPQLTAEEARKELAASEHVQMVLGKYRKSLAHFVSLKQFKPDMKACKQVHEEHPPPKVHGHIPGVAIGDVFTGKAELSVIGLHAPIMAGIDFTKGDAKGARAICMSGGYKDDDDGGDTFTYTGQGGQKAKEQVKDQVWEKGNLALQLNCRTATPVRVVRAFKCPEGGPPKYVYEGLYAVTDSRMEPSVDGPLVCRFVMERILLESKAPAQKVVYKMLHRKFTNKALGKDGRRRDGRTQGMTAQQQAAREKSRLRALAERAGLVSDDIAGGKERLRIPVFNTVDDARPPAFEYLLECIPASDAAAATVERASSVLGVHSGCGLAAMDDALESSYNADGCLMETHPDGLRECPAGCDGGKAGGEGGKGRSMGMCDRQRVVQRGITHPLEVFRTENRGWGVRCPEEIFEGSYIATYTGELITEADADAMKGMLADGEPEGGMNRDAFFFDLNHFAIVVRRGGFEDGAGAEGGTAFPEGVDEVDELPGVGRPLCVDALRKGSVARFVNHSCEGNLIIQPVLVPGCSTATYKICLFASRDIAPMEELAYDYHYHVGTVENREMKCMCGAANCRGSLL